MARPPTHGHGRKDSSTVLAVRLPDDARRLLDYLTLTSGAPATSAYVRGVLEDHLVRLGFTLEEGAILWPTPTEAVEEWRAQRRAAADG